MTLFRTVLLTSGLVSRDLWWSGSSATGRPVAGKP